MRQEDIDLLNSLEAILDSVDADDIVDVTKLANDELWNTYKACDKVLLDLGEVLHPTTDYAREMHSLRGACKIELVHRGIL